MPLNKDDIIIRNDVHSKSQKVANSNKNITLQKDNFIFSSKLINEKIDNPTNKKFIAMRKEPEEQTFSRKLSQ